MNKETLAVYELAEATASQAFAKVLASGETSPTGAALAIYEAVSKLASNARKEAMYAPYGEFR